MYILLPLTILSLCICYYVLRSDEEDLINNRNRAFYQTGASLEAVFNDVENNHLIVSNSIDIINYCAIDDVSKFHPKYNILRSTSKLIENICISSQYINNVHIYNFNVDFIFSTLTSDTREKFYLSGWYERYKETGIANFIYYNPKKEMPALSDSVVIAKAILKDDYLCGIALYEINASVLKDILFKSGFDNDIQLLYDQNGQIFFASDETLIGKNVNEIGLITTPSETNALYKTRSSLLLKSTINYSYNYLSQANLNSYRNVTGIILLIIGLILLVLIISIVLSFYLSLQFYQSIIQITAALRNDEENGEKEISEDKYNELYYINSHIVSRLNKKSGIEKRLTDQVIALKKAQFIALQTQLNPHFIYNTLNLINVMVLNLAKRDCDASRAIVILSQLLREALDTKKYLVSLNDELEYVKKYITLQQLKYNYDINIAWDIDESLLPHKVIKFMLQPIIENAFEHGFSHAKADEYRMIISATKENDDIAISVTNNGKRIEPEELKILQNNLNSDMIFEQKGIGLMNVNHRIRLIYGDNYGCSIESDDSATTITILLPDDDDMDLPFLN